MTIYAKLVGDDKVIAKLGAIPGRVREELRKAVEEAAIKLQAYVKSRKLSGQVLNVRTGRLRRSINVRIEQSETKVMGYVGTNVEYAALHEYGLRGAMSVREHLRKSKQGKALPVRAHLRNVNYPARSFLRSALADQSDQIVEGIRAAVMKGVK